MAEKKETTILLRSRSVDQKVKPPKKSVSFFFFLIFECFKNKTSPPERIGPFRHLTMGKPAGGLNKIYKKKRGENEEEDG